MDAESIRTMHNLLVLSKLQVNDKLITNGEYFDIYEPTSLRGFMRFLYRENRVSNITRIRECITHSVNFISRTNNDVSAIDSQSFYATTLTNQHKRMTAALNSALKGLETLVITYSDDPVSTVQVGIVIGEIEDFLTSCSKNFEHACLT
jgi:hypothetical protein